MAVLRCFDVEELELKEEVQSFWMGRRRRWPFNIQLAQVVVVLVDDDEAVCTILSLSLSIQFQI